MAKKIGREIGTGTVCGDIGMLLYVMIGLW